MESGMSSDELKIFTVGYADNTMTSYLLNYFIKQGVQIGGVIFIKNKIRRDWKRFVHKLKMRGINRSGSMSRTTWSLTMEPFSNSTSMQPIRIPGMR